MAISINTDYRSSNYNGRAGATVSGIVWHSTEGYFSSDLDWLCNVDSGVSCHYLIAPNGTIYQLVADMYRAWHAGEGDYLGISDWNTISIGIEISHVAGDAYPSVQIAACGALAAYLIDTYQIPQELNVLHRWIAPDRKTDPTNITDAQFNAWIAGFYAGIDYKAAWGPYYPYTEGFAITTAWQQNYEILGMALTDETQMADGRVVRSFEHGSVVYAVSGATEVWT